MDESLGEEIKITVIATGFRHETPQRREKMMRPASVTVHAGDGAAPKARFASEMVEAEEYSAPATAYAAPAPMAAQQPVEHEAVPQAVPCAALESAPAHNAAPQPRAEMEDLFAPAAVSAPAYEQEDPLDVPAYLRHNSTE
jgi:cell division protein FtsZ